MTTGELPVPVLVSLLFTGTTLAALGGTLWWRRAVRVTAVLVALAGAAAAAAPVFAAAGTSPDSSLVLSGVLLALAVMAYPRVQLDVASALSAVVVVALPIVLFNAERPYDSSLVALVLAGVPLLQLWWRLEGATPGERSALSWVLVAVAGVSFAGLVLGMLEAPPVVVALYLPSFLLIGAAAWLGTSPDAVDVRGVVATVTTNTFAALAVFAVFRLCSVALEAAGADVAGAAVTGLLATATAFLLAPLRRELRVVADELLFGVRPDPLVAAGRVALGVGDDPQTALDTLRGALVLPFAELRIDGFPVTTSGAAVEHLHRVPLLADGQRVGDLVVGLRPGDLALSSADATVLSLAAPLLAQTVRARALAEGLQQARAATATAREEERRRLRRDLHDGLGPRLSGIAFTADAARLSEQDPDALTVHLARVRSEAVTAMREIRALVHDLRPPALDELGLVEAIRLQSASLRSDGGRPMAVEVTSADTPHLPAAIEVAAYRITMEALTNSARHSGGGRAWVGIDVADGALNVSVRDDGAGAAIWAPGVGLTSMAERAGELGGSVSFSAGEVRAVLPL